MKRFLLLAAFFAACGLSASPAQAWKFVVMADSQGYGGDNTNQVAANMLGDMAAYVAGTERPDLVVFVGDLTDAAASQASVQSSLTTWKNVMAPIYNAGIAVYPLRGSHDLGGNDMQTYSNAAWQNVFDLPTNGPAGESEMTYSVTHNNAKFILLDEWESMPGKWSTVNNAWVNSQLAGNTSPHVFSFTHSQIVKVQHDACLDLSDPTSRNALVSSLRAAGAKVQFTGHMHVSNYTKLNDTAADPSNTAEEDNFYQVIVAPSSPKYYDWNPEVYDGNPVPGMTPSKLYNAEYVNGYSVVDVDGYDVTVTFMKKLGAGNYVPDASFSYTVVPEPASLSLLALGGLALTRRRLSAKK